MLAKKFLVVLISIPILFILVSSLTRSVSWVHAQTPDDSWSTPTNLSNSGGTRSPVLVIDSDNHIHVIWQDNYVGTVYTHFDGTQWSAPQSAFFPFSSPINRAQPGGNAPAGSVPTLISDPNGRIHAFWSDEENKLYHSFVSSENFADPGAWSGAVQIAESAIDFDVVIDINGQLHLAYVRGLDSSEFPAGVYYRSTSEGGTNWSLPKPIYLSPYFRSETGTDANVDITNQGSQLFISWDNRTRKQVFSASSRDRGESWSEPELVSSPTEENPGARPADVKTAVYEGGLLRFWQDGDPNVNCIQYYQFSTDRGVTWSEPEKMLGGISGCPQDVNFFESDGLFVMMTNIQGQIYLLAWDGNRWSNPIPQGELLGFEDPATYDQVIFDCRQPAQDTAGNLYVVGCDTGSGGDIWLTHRSIGDVSQWFPPPSAWTAPEQITTSDSPITDPILLSDSLGRLHAFWIQKESPPEKSNSSSLPRDAIYYARKDSEGWTTPLAVLQSPDGMTRQPSAVIDRNDNISIVWSGGESGEIYFSRARGSNANNPAEWVEPILLPSVRQVGGSPDIEIAENGDIYVAYAIPLNENRGAYVVSSTDGGSTWSKPNLALDAIQEDWEMVGQPHLAINGDGTIQLITARLSLPDGSGSKGLYATNSSQADGNWSDLDVLTETPVQWSNVIRTSNNDVMRAWLESSNGGDFIKYQVSSDNGVIWSTQDSISTIGNIIAFPALTSDISGQIYLSLPVIDPVQGTVIRNWLWNRKEWKQADPLVLDNRSEVSSIGTVISPQGQFGLAFTGPRKEIPGNPVVYSLDFSSRIVEIPAVAPEATAGQTPQPTVTNQIESTELPIAPATAAATAVQINNTAPSSETSQTWGGLILGTIVAFLIATVIFVMRLLYIKR